MNGNTQDWKKKNLQPTVREVPAKFDKGRKWDSVEYWKPLWWQRVQILFGFNVVIHVKMISEHNPGRMASSCTPQITKYSLEELKENPSVEKLEADNPVETKKVGDVELQKAQ